MRWRDFRPLARLVGRLLQNAAGPASPASGRPAADFHGLPQMRYRAEGPGGYRSAEMVWTWVAFEEDPSQGKDRPVLLIGSDAGWLLGLPATSKDHDRDAEQENRAGRYWIEIGSGDWDTKRRISEVRTDRIVRIDPAKIRRASGTVSPAVFQSVIAGVQKHWND